METKRKINEKVEYVDTLRSREFKIEDVDLINVLGLPIENIVDIYYSAGFVHIVTDKTFIEPIESING